MPRTSRPITVTLGDLQERVEARVKSGAYTSTSEVMRAAVRALEREEAALNESRRRRVDEAFAAPGRMCPPAMSSSVCASIMRNGRRVGRVKRFNVSFRPLAEADLFELYRYIAGQAGGEAAGA